MSADYPEDTAEMAALRRASRSLEVGYAPSKAKERLFPTPIPAVTEKRRPETALDRALGTIARLPRVSNKTYIIRCRPFIKIGMAVDVEARFRSLQASNPHPLEMVAIIPGGRAVERALHVQFAAYRHRDEWFREEAALARWIKAGCPFDAGGADG
jgi:hypothetical protein